MAKSISLHIANSRGPSKSIHFLSTFNFQKLLRFAGSWELRVLVQQVGVVPDVREEAVQVRRRLLAQADLGATQGWVGSAALPGLGEEGGVRRLAESGNDPQSA